MLKQDCKCDLENLVKFRQIDQFGTGFNKLSIKFQITIFIEVFRVTEWTSLDKSPQVEKP